MAENKLNLNDQVNPKTRAIIWLTNADISNRLKYFQPINYLLNGLLVNNNSESNKNRTSFFMSEGFGKPFFMGHIQIDNNQLDNDLHSMLDLIVPHCDDESEVIILNESQKLADKLVNKIKGRFSKLNFSWL